MKHMSCEDGMKRAKVWRVLPVIAVVTGLVVFSLVVLTGTSGNEYEHDVVVGKVPENKDIIEDDGTQSIQSSLLYAGASKTTGDFEARIKEHVASLDGCYGIYFMDTSRRIEFGVNENEEFYA